MENNFANRLKEYLDFECSDYDLTYKWEWNEDIGCCEVEVKRDQNTKYLNFRYDKNKDDLSIELSANNFYVTREFDHTVKYFWMLISPTLFPDL